MAGEGEGEGVGGGGLYARVLISGLRNRNSLTINTLETIFNHFTLFCLWGDGVFDHRV